MTGNNTSIIGKIITDYLELKEMSGNYEKKKYDLEREYNRLLTEYHGESKNYSLAQADQIYTIYCEMNDYEQKARIAGESFCEAENKLKDIGKVLYEATIHADIMLPGPNGTSPQTRSFAVIYQEGRVDVHPVKS